eukprot:4338374-Prorocentrum_lima.AAC.1
MGVGVDLVVVNLACAHPFEKAGQKVWGIAEAHLGAHVRQERAYGAKPGSHGLNTRARSKPYGPTSSEQ